jgi:hypothetical protein
MSSEKEILDLEDKRYAAMCGGDFAALERMLHDERQELAPMSQWVQAV